MKTLDELGDDALGYASSDTLGEVNPEAYTERQIGLLHGYIDGYIKCQEDMTKELYEFGKLVLDTFHSEGKTHSGKDRLARVKFDEWFNQVKKD
jgi:hypothetical protein